MIILETQRLRVRNWIDSDRPLFAEINADPKVMEFFPRQRTAVESETLMNEVRRSIDNTGLGFFALALKERDAPVGFIGLALTDLEPFLPNGTVEVGWRLAVPFWGKGYATEAALAMIHYGFTRRDLQEIVSFAVEDNTRSTNVMKRIGMQRDAARDFDHPRVPNEKAHLRRHILYKLSREDWIGRTPSS